MLVTHPGRSPVPCKYSAELAFFPSLCCAQRDSVRAQWKLWVVCWAVMALFSDTQVFMWVMTLPPHHRVTHRKATSSPLAGPQFQCGLWVMLNHLVPFSPLARITGSCDPSSLTGVNLRSQNADTDESCWAWTRKHRALAATESHLHATEETRMGIVESEKSWPSVTCWNNQFWRYMTSILAVTGANNLFYNLRTYIEFLITL